jgi:hypothetical protein
VRNAAGASLNLGAPAANAAYAGNLGAGGISAAGPGSVVHVVSSNQNQTLEPSAGVLTLADGGMFRFYKNNPAWTNRNFLMTGKTYRHVTRVNRSIGLSECMDFEA